MHAVRAQGCRGQSCWIQGGDAVTTLKTCRPCVRRGDCAIKRDLLATLRGTRIVGLVTHSCGERAIPYSVGQAVWAEVNDVPHEDDDCGSRYGPTRAWFPAHFLEVARINTRAVVVIAKDVRDRTGDCEFTPIGGKRGAGVYAVCKVLWARIEPRDAPTEALCAHCGVLPFLMACDRPSDCRIEGKVEENRQRAVADFLAWPS